MTRRLRQGDDGIALVVSIALMGLVTVLMLTIVAFALTESRQSGRERQRASAVATAEGQLDVMQSSIRAATPATLPCQSTATGGSGADAATVQTSVTYYDASGTAVACPVSSTTTVASALIRSTATTQPIAGQAPAVRTMESLLRLTPTYVNGLDKALFGEQGLSMQNGGTIFAQSGKTDADIYTNGNFNCSNNQTYHGSIYAQGSITFANGSSCTVDGDVWAKMGVDDTKAAIGGRVLVSNGNVSITNGSVAGVVQASGSIGWSSCTSSKCYPNTAVDDPPHEGFPQVPWNTDTQSDWAAHGYNRVVEVTACGTGSTNAAGQWIVDNGGTLDQPTILRTPCSVAISNPGRDACGDNKHICLSNNLAIFADGGIRFANGVHFTSTNSTTRNLYLIQPWGTSCTGADAGINVDNKSDWGSTVNALLYTPCNINKANNTDHYGQMYAGGTANISNSLTMYYRPLPVWGVVGTTNTVASYSIDIAYTRENR